MNFLAFKKFDKTAAITAGVWLIFLLYPVQYLWSDSSYQPWQTYGGTASILIFCILYVMSFGANSVIAIDSASRRVLAWSGVLLIPAIFLCITLGPWVLFLVTYFISLWAFTLPGLGTKVGSGIGLLTAFVMFFFYRTVWDNGGYGFIIGAGFVILFAQLMNASEARRQKEQELAKARQAEKIARDVHDILGHTLTVINLKAELAIALSEANPGKARTEIQQVAELSRTALAEVRATVTRMKSPDFAGELEASRRALETAQITAHLPSAEQASLPGMNATLFSWVLREAVTNVVRHSQAQNCWVTLEAERLEIVDDGGSTTLEPGNGLSGLQARIQEAGGDLILAAGEQTRLLVTMNGDTSPMMEPLSGQGEAT